MPRSKSKKINAINRYEIEKKSALLEQVYVHDVYERIAEDFEDKQYKPWPKISEFLLNLEPGSLVLDAGCGNGHYLNINPYITVMGADRSINLLGSASSRAPGVLCRADCLSLPYRDGAFDAVLFIGVIHHLVSARRQAKAIQELERVVRPGGTILIYAWAWEQQTRKFVGQNLLVPRYTTESSCCGCALPKANQTLVQETKPQNILISKLERLLLGGPQSFLKRLVNRQDSLESCDDSSSTNSVQSTDSDEWVICDEKLCSDEYQEIPAEFQVREFPASSLFAPSSLSKNTQGNCSHTEHNSTQKVYSRLCRNHQTSCLHTCTSSRDERYYHVFREGELEKLVHERTKDLRVVSCTYNSGQWCTMLAKAEPPLEL